MEVFSRKKLYTSIMVVGISTGCNGGGASLNKEENYNKYWKEVRIDRESGRNKEAIELNNKGNRRLTGA